MVAFSPSSEPLWERRQRERDRENQDNTTRQDDKTTRPDKIKTAQGEDQDQDKDMYKFQDRHETSQIKIKTRRSIILILFTSHNCGFLSHDRYGIRLTTVKESRSVESRHEDAHKAETETAVQ
jgi:hypothetical protein